jgi:hypothetical protein
MIAAKTALIKGKGVYRLFKTRKAGKKATERRKGAGFEKSG